MADLVWLLFDMPLLGLLLVAVIAFVIFKSDGWGEAGKFLVFIVVLAIVGIVGAIARDYFGELLETISDITGLKEKTIVILAKIIGIIAAWAIIIWFWIGGMPRDKNTKEENENK